MRDAEIVDPLVTSFCVLDLPWRHRIHPPLLEDHARLLQLELSSQSMAELSTFARSRYVPLTLLSMTMNKRTNSIYTEIYELERPQAAGAEPGDIFL